MRKDDPFFIVGLPRTRSAWLANFLTWNDSFCFHEAIRQCESPADLPSLLDRAPGAVAGDADPSLPLFWREVRLIRARWVIVRRDRSESLKSYAAMMGSTPAREAPGFDRLADAFDTMQQEIQSGSYGPWMEIGFGALDKIEHIRALWHFCLGTLRPFPEERWRMLDQMRVNAIPDKIKASISPARAAALIAHTHPAETAATDRLHAQYTQLLSEICHADPDAYRWLLQVTELQTVWDHIMDDDPLDKSMADRVFESLVLDWGQNPFWIKYRLALLPTLSNAIGAWRASDALMDGKGYDGYTEVPLAVAFVLGGQTLVNRYSDSLRRLVAEIREDNDRKDTV